MKVQTSRTTNRTDAVRRSRVRGLYAVTPDAVSTEDLVARVEAALAGGASLIQYRNKSADNALRVAQARELRKLCDRWGAPLIINDHVDLALEVGADGVHLGQDDGSLQAARRRLGSDRTLGVSCYDVLQKAIAAEQSGADYVAFGSFFASDVKPHAVRAPLTLLREARQVLSVPIVAIGGITPHNAELLVEAGADAVAVISALFDAGDVSVAARRFGILFGIGT